MSTVLADSEPVIRSQAIRSLHVVGALDPALGGPSYTVPRLCAAMVQEGAEVALFSVTELGQESCETTVGSYPARLASRDYAVLPLLRDLRCSSGLLRLMRQTAPNTDVIHDHGIWLMPNVYAGRVAARAGKPLIITPRGMLAPEALAFSRWRKVGFWHLLQGSVMRQAACIHATSEQEYNEIRAFGLANPVAIVRNGIDLPPAGDTQETGSRTMLSLGRLHPKKGLDRLIRAWAQVENSYPAWQLRIVGPGEAGYDSELRTLAASLGARRILIESAVYGEAKLAAYRQADVFALTTLNENFGITVAEALAAGTPVIATEGAPWSDLVAERCGWWVEHGVEALAATLTKVMAMPRDELKAMGANGRAWMERDYSWERVARDMLDVYHWLCRGCEPPPSVRFD